MTTKLWSRRQKGRGVAMVEAGILAPIFAMMMMMTVYLMGTYETKVRTMNMSRYAVFSYASNGCSNEQFKPITSDIPVGIKDIEQTGGSGGNATQQQSVSSGDSHTSQVEADNGSNAGASLLIAKGHATMTWDYSPTYKFNNGNSKQITTDGQTVCNPVPVGMNIASYISQVGKNLF